MRNHGRGWGDMMEDLTPRALLVPLVGLGAIAAVGALVFVWSHGVRTQSPRIAHDVVNTGSSDNQPKDTLGLEAGAAAATTAHRDDGPNVRTLYDKSRNYWQFANKVLSAAKAGDRDAQFYLYKALKYCLETNATDFQWDGRPLELGEAIQKGSRGHISADAIQADYDRCHEFRTHNVSDLGDPATWLAKATEAGQPVAQATTANQMLFQQRMRSFVAAGAVPTPLATAPTVGEGLDPRDLSVQAASSGDPEALFMVGESLQLMHPGNSVDQFAWMLLACQRGLDCSSNADWVRARCGTVYARCDFSSPINLISGMSGSYWPSVQARADEIGASIDAGNWDSVGLGDPSD